MAPGWGRSGENAFPGFITECCLTAYRISCEGSMFVNIRAGAEQMRLLPGFFRFNVLKGVGDREIESFLGGG